MARCRPLPKLNAPTTWLFSSEHRHWTWTIHPPSKPLRYQPFTVIDNGPRDCDIPLTTLISKSVCSHQKLRLTPAKSLSAAFSPRLATMQSPNRYSFPSHRDITQLPAASRRDFSHRRACTQLWSCTSRPQSLRDRIRPANYTPTSPYRRPSLPTATNSPMISSWPQNTSRGCTT